MTVVARNKTFRIRLPNGATERITLLPTEGLARLGRKIEALNKLDGQFSLYADPAFKAPFVFERASHGDFVFIKGTVIQTAAPAASSPDPMSDDSIKRPKAADNKPTDKKTPSGPGPRCRHGPRGMCEQCMPTEDKTDRLQRALDDAPRYGTSLAVMEALEALKFKISPQENAHVTSAAVFEDAAHAFQAYLAEIAFSQQRIGFCYGTVDEEANTSVLTIYEPPQKGNGEAYALVEGEEAGDMSTRAERVAELLGLQRVGMVFSAKPRNSILSAMDIVFAATVISELTPEQRKAFVIFVVTTAETGQTLFEAYQISDLAIQMYEANAFEELAKQKPNGGRVLCKQEVLVEGKDVRKVPTDFFLINVPIKSCDSWLRTSFAIENRELAPQGPADLKRAVEEESLAYPKRLADFHLLLFLSNIFDIDSDMPGLCAAVKQEDDIGEGYRLMIDNMAASS